MTTTYIHSPFIIITTLVVISILSLYLSQTRRQLAHARTAARYATQHARQMIGSTCLWNSSQKEPLNYHLRSFDGGESWVAVTMDSDSRMRIIGEVNHIYPGLLTHLLATTRLIEQDVSNGPLSLSNSRDQQLLTDAGFTIQKTPNTQRPS